MYNLAIRKCTSLYISTPPSPEVGNFEMKIYYPAGDRTPDLLNQRQTCYHLSQRGELMWYDIVDSSINSFFTYWCPLDLSLTNPYRKKIRW